MCVPDIWAFGCLIYIVGVPNFPRPYVLWGIFHIHVECQRCINTNKSRGNPPIPLIQVDDFHPFAVDPKTEKNYPQRMHGTRKTYLYLPRTQMTLGLIGKGLVLGGWPSKMEAIGVLGTFYTLKISSIQCSYIYCSSHGYAVFMFFSCKFPATIFWSDNISPSPRPSVALRSPAAWSVGKAVAFKRRPFRVVGKSAGCRSTVGSQSCVSLGLGFHNGGFF